jgi:hypothetical protein
MTVYLISGTIFDTLAGTYSRAVFHNLVLPQDSLHWELYGTPNKIIYKAKN